MKTRFYIYGIIFTVCLAFTAQVNAQFANPRFGMQFGSMFTAGGAYGNMFSNSIAPRLNMDLSKDFHLEVGTIFSTSRFSGSPGQGLFSYGSESTLFDQPAAMNSATMYAFGVYRLNPKLSISGGTWFERTNFDMSQTTMNPYAMNQNPRGMMLGLDYRVTENLRFGVEVSASSGMSPMTAPGLYQHSAFPGGFYNHNPFHRYGRW